MDSENLFNIKLTNNQGKKWVTYGNCHIKGYAFHNDEILEGRFLLDVILESIESKKLDSVLKELNGNFTAVIIIDSSAYLISDKLRSYPLIFTLQKDGKWFITDSAIGIDNNKNVNRNIDTLNSIEFLSLGYVSGNETLFEDVLTVDAGEYVILRKGAYIQRSSYFKYIFDKKVFNKGKTIEDAYKSLEKAFQRTIASIPSGKQIIIPLSGGYDSRLIACLCKKYGLKDVVCYTYGRYDSFEVSISRKVADQLGFKWYYIEYQAENFAKTLCREHFNDFTKFTNNCNSIPHVQEFLALQELRSQGILQEGSIVIPGFCGDLFGGSKVPPEVFNWKKNKFNHKNFSRLIYQHFYDLNIPNTKWKNKIINKIRSEIGDYDVSNQEKFLNHYEQWCISNRLSKYIINSLRVYEFFGLDWRMPLWDDNYARLWYQVPWYDKSPALLADFMFNKYFIPYKVDIRKTESSNSQKTLVFLVKKLLPVNLYNVVKKLHRTITINHDAKDFNCFEETSKILSRNISKNTIDAHISKFKDNNILATIARYELPIIFDDNPVHSH